MKIKGHFSTTINTIGVHLDLLTEETKLSPFALQDAASDVVVSAWRAEEFSRVARLAGFRLNAERNTSVRLLVNGEEQIASTFDSTDQVHDSSSGFQGTVSGGLRYENGAAFKVSSYRHDGTGHASAADGAILAPMPGNVIAVDVAEGEAVATGQRLMVLEAMKMEHALTAPFDGIIKRLAVSAGAHVQVDLVLCVVGPAGCE